jgi:hypothetical protein
LWLWADPVHSVHFAGLRGYLQHELAEVVCAAAVKNNE